MGTHCREEISVWEPVSYLSYLPENLSYRLVATQIAITLLEACANRVSIRLL